MYRCTTERGCKTDDVQCVVRRFKTKAAADKAMEKQLQINPNLKLQLLESVMDYSADFAVQVRRTLITGS